MGTHLRKLNEPNFLHILLEERQYMSRTPLEHHESKSFTMIVADVLQANHLSLH